MEKSAKKEETKKVVTWADGLTYACSESVGLPACLPKGRRSTSLSPPTGAPLVRRRPLANRVRNPRRRGERAR